MKRDAALHGYIARFTMCIAAIPSFVAVCLAAAVDVRTMLCSRDQTVVILTVVAFFSVLGSCARLTKCIADCSVDHSFDQSEAIVAQHGIGSVNKYFAYMFLVYRLERLAQVGRQLLFLYAYFPCLRPKWYSSKASNVVVPVDDAYEAVPPASPGTAEPVMMAQPVNITDEQSLPT